MDAPIKGRMEVKCVCGHWGRLYPTNQFRDGKQVCNFKCGCDNPQVDFKNPWGGK